MSLEAALNPTRPKGENESHLLLLILTSRTPNSTEIPRQLHTHFNAEKCERGAFFLYSIHTAMD